MKNIDEALKDLLKVNQERVNLFNEEEKALISRINFCDSHKFHEEKRIAIIKQEAISRVIYRYKSMVDELNQLFINNKTQ